MEWFCRSATSVSKKFIEVAIEPITVLQAALNGQTGGSLVGFVSRDSESIHTKCPGQLVRSESVTHPEVAQPITKGFWRDEVVINVAANIGKDLFEPSLQDGEDAPQNPGLNNFHLVPFYFGDGVMAQFYNCGIQGYAFITEPLSEVSKAGSQCGFGGVENGFIYR